MSHLNLVHFATEMDKIRVPADLEQRYYPIWCKNPDDLV